MNRAKVYAGISAVLLALCVNLAPLSGGSSVLQLQTANAEVSNGTIDASAAWNQVCAQWEFPSASFGGTFAEAWAAVPNHHITYDIAIAGIRGNVNYLMNIPSPPLGGDEALSVRVHNWAVN